MKDQEFTEAVQIPKTPFFLEKVDGTFGLGYNTTKEMILLSPFYLFSFWLDNSSEELVFGAIDHDRYQDELIWFDVHRKREIPLEGIYYDNDIFIRSSASSVVIDTSSSMLIGPNADSINHRLNATKMHDGRHIFSCFKVHELDDNQCVFAFIQGGTSSWFLGTVFFKKYYSVFDLNNDRIGLAKAIH